jgi:DNA-binding NarL/FixJ family response regulator
MLRILIADDHAIVLRGIQSFVNAHPGWRVCAAAQSTEAAFRLALQTKPHIAILDVQFPDDDGLSLAQRLREALPLTNTLMFTMRGDLKALRRALAARVRGYVLKSDGNEQLEAGIMSLAAHRTFFSSSLSEALIHVAQAERQGAPLNFATPRQMDVVRLLAIGHSNKSIAQTLAISVKTVEAHRATVFRKADVHTAADFVRFAIKNNLLG